MIIPHFKKIILTLYTLLIVCMGVATFVEKSHGTEFTATAIYGSWWFITLWALLIALSFVFLIMKGVHKRPAVMLLHVSFAVILLGALVTHLTSESGTIHLRKGIATAEFTDDDGMVRHLPFSMMMTGFNVLCYPGTDAVMDYCCTIKVMDKDISVSMNNIGKVQGYRFYQSAYDSDGEGSQLLVAYDPYGIAITYSGYLMLLFGLLWTIFSRHTRIRQLYRVATKKVLFVMAFILFATTAGAEEMRGTVLPEIAHEFGKVTVLYNGRLCPVNTAATDFLTKLTGKSKWEGYSADEVFVGWMIYYSDWETKKIIRVKSQEVQRIIGIDGKWACVRDFYTPQNEYKLKGLANDASLDESTRKAIRETDEKIQVITMFYNSELLRIFPLTHNGTLQWYTPGSTELPLGIPEAEFQFINHAMDNLVKSILVNDVANAKLMIRKIRLYQKEKAADVLPSVTETNIEMFHNTLLSARWWVFVCLTLSIVFCIISFCRRSSRFLHVSSTVFVVVLTAYLTLLLTLRWWISGHAPMSNGYETMVFMSWATMAFTILTMRKAEIVRSLGPVVASLCLLVSMLATGSPQITNLMPVLQSPLLTLHVAVVMTSYALFAMITILSIYGIVLCRKPHNAEQERTTALSQLLLYPAVALLTIGIFIGAVWANVSWGTYWSWDPKETWALITLMVYAIPLHRSFMSVSPYRYHLYILLSFLTLLMTYFGVNYFLPGMHSYA